MLATGAWGLSQKARAERAEMLVAAHYQQSFYDLLGHVENVAVLLSKSRAAGSPGQAAMLLTDAWSQALAAQARLNGLPMAPGTQRRTSTFLTQTGDFAHMMAARASRGDAGPADADTVLADLQQQAELLARELHTVSQQASQGRWRWGDIQRMASAQLADTPAHPLGQELTRIEQELMEYPTLLYDGPFSDHVTRRRPRTVPTEEVSVEAAQETAVRFLTAAFGNVDGSAVRFTGEVNGHIPAYRFDWEPGQGPSVRIDVARRGGDVVWMVDPRPTRESRLSAEEAVERARSLAASVGLSSVDVVFPLKMPGRMLIPLAPVDDGVVAYPDQVKVTVSLEDGRIVGYTAVDYLMNRGPRTVPDGTLTEEEAAQRLHPRLERDGQARRAWIVDEALKEHFVYEFPVRSEGDRFLVYIDAVTGDEVRIERIIPTEEGDLVM